jgi:ADP-heptose:LPS heptosyltransferase
VPGAAPHRPKKRWPAEKFGALAAALNMRLVILGTAHEQRLAREILQHAPDSVDLTGRTTLADVSEVLARAAFAIGNDTGLMHLATAFNVPSVVLFSLDSDPKLTAPRYPDGHWPTVIRAQNLADLPVDRVVAAISGRHKHSSLTI